MEVPTEIWCHILNFVTGYRDVISCKRVSWVLYNVAKSRKAFPKVAGIQWDEKVTSFFASQQVHPRATKEQIKNYWNSHPESRDKTYDNKEFLYVIKSVLVGPVNSGKATFRRTISQGWYTDYEPKLGTSRVCSEFSNKLITNSDSVSTQLQIWDTHYPERYQMLSASYFRGTSVVLLCFAINDRSSFVQLMEKTLAQCYVFFDRLDLPQFYLVGLKADLAQDRAVSADEAEAVAGELHMKYFEVSCKQYPRGNLNEMLQEIGEDALARLTWRKLPDEMKAMKPVKADPVPNRKSWTISSVLSSISTRIGSLFK